MADQLVLRRQRSENHWSIRTTRGFFIIQEHDNEALEFFVHGEYIGMNKLKWLLLVVYGLYIILLRIPKLAILSKLPIKKDIYIELVFWFR